ncbi:MAG: MarR family transcriptional regulator [Candidatus Omnitrophica bacterium]|nr:MarR family transcriptional regulator [Candidatus Omnitrophota bacterium]
MNNLDAFGVETGKGRYDEEAFYQFVLVYTLLFDRISKYLDRFDLTPAKMNVLMVIKHQGGAEGLSQREIGQRLLVTASNMTRVLDKLEREKLIERAGRLEDRRVKVVRISKKGSQILDSVWPGYVKEMRTLMNKLSSDDQKNLAGIFKKWLVGLGN